MKRTDYISWDEYFMGIAYLSSLFDEKSFFVGDAVSDDFGKDELVALINIRCILDSELEILYEL